MRLHTPAFGRRLKAIRTDRNLTRAELAALIGRSPQTIHRWESGAVLDIREADVRKCAKALRCRIRDLRAPPDTPLPPRPSRWTRMKSRIQRRVSQLTGKPLRRRRAGARQLKNQLSGGIECQVNTEKHANPDPAKCRGHDRDVLTPLERIRGLLEECSQDDLQILLAVILKETAKAAA